MSKSGYSTPELMKMPAQELYDKDNDTLVKIAQQLTSVVNKRINRMHETFGDAAYKYVDDFENNHSYRQDFRNWDRPELEKYTKDAKNFLNAKTTITGYSDLVEKRFSDVSDIFDIESDDMNITDKALLVRDLFNTLDDLKEEYPVEFEQYGSGQEMKLISESFKYYKSPKKDIKEMPLLIEAMRKHKTIKQLKQEEYEKENVNDTSDVVYDIGGFWSVK